MILARILKHSLCMKRRVGFIASSHVKQSKLILWLFTFHEDVPDGGKRI